VWAKDEEATAVITDNAISCAVNGMVVTDVVDFRRGACAACVPGACKTARIYVRAQMGEINHH
jgi:hypothetical protein